MTRILAFDTSHNRGSVALLDNAALVLEMQLPVNPRSAVTLAPAIDALFNEAGWRRTTMDLIAVTRGPGSFTGLRIGLTTAKLLAYAWSVPLVSVLTTDTVAQQAAEWWLANQAAQAKHSLKPKPTRFLLIPNAQSPTPICVALDAHRQQVFAADYQLSPEGQVTATGETDLRDISAWLASLTPGTLVAGPILERLAPQLPAGVITLANEIGYPRASTVGRLAVERFNRGERDDPFQLVPLYLRPSYAEESRSQRPVGN